MIDRQTVCVLVLTRISGPGRCKVRFVTDVCFRSLCVCFQ